MFLISGADRVTSFHGELGTAFIPRINGFRIFGIL